MRRSSENSIAASLSILIPLVFAGCSGSTHAPEGDSSGGAADASGGLSATSGGAVTQGKGGGGGSGGIALECVATVSGCKTVYYAGATVDLNCRSTKLFASTSGPSGCLVSPSCTNGCLDKVYSCSDQCLEQTRQAILSSCSVCDDEGLLCASLATDSGNCGSCGNACKVGTRCENGACGTCTGGLTDCGAACAQLNGDPANCGRCGNACQPNQACTQGTCVSPP